MTDEHRYAIIDGARYRLASWVPREERFQDIYIPLDPALRFLPNRGEGLVGDEGATYWNIDSFKGGEGYEMWNPEVAGFFKGQGIQLERTAAGGEGLTCGPLFSITQDNTGASDLADAGILARGVGAIFTCKDASAYQWDPTNERWGAAIATGSVSACTSMVDFGDASNMLSMHSDGAIRKWNSGANSQHFAAGTFSTKSPVIHEWGGRVWALDQDDLYEIDLSAVDTRTLVRDVEGQSDDYLTSSPWANRRIASSDVGPIWLQRLDSGETYVWEYNVAQEVGARIGKLPIDFAFPYDIHFTAGFIFVTFKDSLDHNGDGDLYLYYQRGAQRGVLGPLNVLGAKSGAAALIAGTKGAELLITSRGELVAYNLSNGGLFQAGTTTAIGDNIENAAVFGNKVFMHIASNDKVEIADYDHYNTRTGLTFGRPTIHTGWYDLSYFDIPKLFLDVTLFTDQLPAGTSVELAYAVDRGSFTTHSTVHNTSGGTQQTFVLSSSGGGSLRGRKVAFQLKPIATSSAAPVIRGLLVRAVSGAKERRVILAIDCSTDDAGEQLGEDILDELRTLAAKDEIVSVSLPFESREQTADETIDMAVRTVRLPEIQTAQPTALLELQAKDLTS